MWGKICGFLRGLLGDPFFLCISIPLPSFYKYGGAVHESIKAGRLGRKEQAE